LVWLVGSTSKSMSTLHRAALSALGAAILFGASTPFAKQLIGDGLATASPFLLAGLLYLGSGLGLTLMRLLRDRGWKPIELPRDEWPWLLGAIAFGGVLGPLSLMVGLSHSTAATASLFLNLESVLTAVLAWVVFRESTDRRIVLGMLMIVAGGAVLAWPGGEASAFGIGPLALAGACLAWAIDNNLTRKVSGVRCAVHCRQQRPGSRGCQHRSWARSGRCLADGWRAVCRVVGWFSGLWTESGAFRFGVARAGHCPHRRLFFNRSVCGGRHLDCRVWRAHEPGLLVRCGADGRRCVAAPHRKTPA
jgi:multidrug transporter EmrE-like cation transporter